MGKSVSTAPPPPVVIDNNVRQSWNNFINFLRQKGVAGDPSLDKGGLGPALLNQYVRQNPDSYLKENMVPAIQKDFQNLRDYSLQQVKAGKAAFADGVNEQNFMANLSDVDGYPGQNTTQHIYPQAFMSYMDDQGKLLNTENKGFVQGYATQK